MNLPTGARILFVNHTAELGGGEIALLELVRNLDTSKVQPIVLLFADGPLVPLLRERTEVHILPLSNQVLKANKDRLGIKSVLRWGSLVAGLSFLFRLRRLIRSMGPKLVYTNSLKADLLGGIAGRTAGIPVIWHIRDRIAPDYLPKKIVSLFRALARIIPDYIVANSASTLSTLHLPQSLDKKSRSTFACVIHDGVDLAKYAPISLPAPNEPLIVGLIGRISPWKGQDVFIEAIRLIHQTYPCARFQMIGTATFGEMEFERHIGELQQESGLSSIVQCTGFEPNIPQRLAKLDIVVHASTLPEPFGQVIIEGMAAGRPVIATNGGGVPEIVVDGVTGILVPMRDAQAMASAMARLLSDGDLRVRMGAAARLHIEKHFTIRKTAKAVEAVVEHILAQTQGKS
jgi:glycosyltransferase involved in cell wall biosynthesis